MFFLVSLCSCVTPVPRLPPRKHPSLSPLRERRCMTLKPQGEKGEPGSKGDSNVEDGVHTTVWSGKKENLHPESRVRKTLVGSWSHPGSGGLRSTSGGGKMSAWTAQEVPPLATAPTLYWEIEHFHVSLTSSHRRNPSKTPEITHVDSSSFGDFSLKSQSLYSWDESTVPTVWHTK